MILTTRTSLSDALRSFTLCILESAICDIRAAAGDVHALTQPSSLERMDELHATTASLVEPVQDINGEETFPSTGPPGRTSVGEVQRLGMMTFLEATAEGPLFARAFVRRKLPELFMFVVESTKVSPSSIRDTLEVRLRKLAIRFACLGWPPRGIFHVPVLPTKRYRRS